MKRTTRRPAAKRPIAAARQAVGDGLQSLQTAFRILDELSNAHQPVGLTDLAGTLGELKPRVYRHLSTMKRIGVVFQDARNGQYSLGGKLFSLGEAALEQFDLRFVAAPYLTRLRDQTRQTALLSVPGNGEAIVLSCVEYRDRLYEAARRRILGRKLTSFTKHSITDVALVEKRIGVIRERLFEDAVDEVRLGINALSAPIFRDHDEFIGIIGIIGTSVEIGTPPSRPLIASLHHVAGSLSAELNCRIYYERGLIK